MVSYGWLWLVMSLYIILDTGLKPPRVAVHLSGTITKVMVPLRWTATQTDEESTPMAPSC